MKRIAIALSENVQMKFIAYAMIFMKFSLLAILAYRIITGINTFQFSIDTMFLYFVGIGFLAQLVDGALGMAYGASCTSMLMGLGVPPAYATASVHTAEVFTTGVSGLSHIYFGNIDKKLFFRIVLTGVVGAMIGAYLISDVFDGKAIKPYIAIYMIILGGIIISKAFKKRPTEPQNKNLGLLGFFGGFLDAVGGGGWGPLVTSNLISKGNAPKEAIGTVNTAEFFVSFFSTGVFMLFIDIQAWQAIAGLIIGGVFAAPLGAFLVKLFPPKTIMISVGVLVVLLNIWNLAKAWL
ncbi:sulfite exporter TauE/SafE family protein [Emticicia sp. SJ17W-69]|uniref:sulfite exporter TauE/SafE family protein n=1 Tax=Emticicia sp. SJ17W-69 TaxID=3421657 RepID=UPI003EBA763E